MRSHCPRSAWFGISSHSGVHTGRSDTWVTHYAVQAGLTRVGAGPWRYGSFLEAMTQRLLLRRSGSAYLFVHRLLRDHLGDLDHTAAAQSASAAADTSR